MKGKLFRIFLISFFFTSCSTLAPEPTPTPIPTATSTLTPTLTPTPTKVPTSTPTATPTPLPTPTNLKEEYFCEYEIIDPYEFYIEQKGYIQFMHFRPTYETLNLEKGDNITGNRKDGWYITYKDQIIYYGPGKESADGTGTEFEMWVGEKGSGDTFNIIQRKKFFVLNGEYVTTYFKTWYPGPPRFVYYPAKSSFILGKREDPKQNFSIHPAYSPLLLIMITPDNQVLIGRDYEKWPEWCGKSTYDKGWATGTVGYTIEERLENGEIEKELFYWGRLPGGELKCPFLKIIEE